MYKICIYIHTMYIYMCACLEYLAFAAQGFINRN